MSCSLCRTFYAPLIGVNRKLFGRLSFCGQVGALLGAQIGALCGLLMREESLVGLSQKQILTIALILAAVAASFAILVVVGFERRSSSAVPGIVVNAIATGIAVVEINFKIAMPALATLIGILVGVMVGTVLCAMRCRLRGAVAPGRGDRLHG
jgi:hypothetical protein